MPSTLKSAFLAVLFILTLSSCTKDEQEFSLPPITEDGRNTLGFKSNGKVWVNYGDICNWGVCDDNVVAGRLHSYKNGSKAVIIEAYYNNPEKNISQLFQIVAEEVSGTGTYELKYAGNNRMTLSISSGSTFYTNQEGSEATLTITRLDTNNHIISGTFNGTLHLQNDPTKTVAITDGRFDTKLTYSNE